MNTILKVSRPLLAGLLVALVGLAGWVAAAGDARRSLPDPLDIAVKPVSPAPKGVTSGIARQGDRLLAVGARGLILLSTDGARSWAQVASPVATDPVTVKFTGANTAWAVGHDGVALRSIDGGASWQRLLDGRALLKLLNTAYAERVKNGEPGAEGVAKEIQRAVAQSATPDVLPSPLLDVWFADANEGYLVGAFGLLLRTQDGGQTWQPLIEHADNERRFHLYTVSGQGDHRWIAGEQGLLMRWDAARSRFVKVATPYNGSFFGLQVGPRQRVAFGLRGNAFASDDDGARWRKIDTGTDANLVALVPLPTSATDAGRFLLVSQAGQLLLVNPGSSKAVALQRPFTTEVYGAVAGKPGSLALAQVNGLRDVELPGLPAQ